MARETAINDVTNFHAANLKLLAGALAWRSDRQGGHQESKKALGRVNHFSLESGYGAASGCHDEGLDIFAACITYVFISRLDEQWEHAEPDMAFRNPAALNERYSCGILMRCVDISCGNCGRPESVPGTLSRFLRLIFCY
jgi:hypothetical protein